MSSERILEKLTASDEELNRHLEDAPDGNLPGAEGQVQVAEFELPPHLQLPEAGRVHVQLDVPVADLDEISLVRPIQCYNSTSSCYAGSAEKCGEVRKVRESAGSAGKCGKVRKVQRKCGISHLSKEFP